MSDGKMWEIEDGFFSSGVGTICGVDEAGRGPLAGPVYAAAVILPPHLDIPGLTDSKKLTDKKTPGAVPNHSGAGDRLRDRIRHGEGN